MKPTYNKQGKKFNLFAERPYFSKNIIELREVVAKQFAKPKSWYLQDMNWRHERRQDLYEEILTKQIESKIFQFVYKRYCRFH